MFERTIETSIYFAPFVFLFRHNLISEVVKPLVAKVNNY